MRGPGDDSAKRAKARAADFDALCAAVSALRNREEAARFLKDIATPAELDAFAERWRIARLLDAGTLSYRDIAASTGASTATVARVARFLKEEPYKGYRLAIDRARRTKRKEQ